MDHSTEACLVIRPKMETEYPADTATAVAVAPGVKTTVLLALVVLLVGLFLAHGFRQANELGFSEDEARQALTGQFFADLIRDAPLHDPVGYTFRYYAHYPALGVVHWPPFFHFVEALVFLTVGPSATAARAAVLLFLLVGLIFWFKLVNEFVDPWAAAFATLALALLPSVFLYSRSVMLEVPALSLCIAASYFWIAFLHRARTRDLYSFAVLAAFALLTKEHSIYLAMFCLLTVLAERKWRLLLSLRVVGAAMLTAALVVPYVAITFHVHSRMIVEHVIQKRGYTADDFAFYVELLPQMLGWPLLVLSGAGILTCAFWGKRRNHIVMLVWIVACYLTFTFLRAREDRYIVYWLPAFVYFSVWPLALNSRRSWVRIAAATVCVLALANSGYRAWSAHNYPYVTGYEPAAKWLNENTAPGPQVILYDGEENGDFIFSMRTHDSSRRLVILRKALYAIRIVKFFGTEQFVRTPEQLQEVLKAYGIRYIVVSDDASFLEFGSQKVLRNLLQTAQFTLIRSFPVMSEGAAGVFHSSNLLVYENLDAEPPEAKFLRIPMMTMDRDIFVPFSRLWEFSAER
jgi:hypothetical protein